MPCSAITLESVCLFIFTTLQEDLFVRCNSFLERARSSILRYSSSKDFQSCDATFGIETAERCPKIMGFETRRSSKALAYAFGNTKSTGPSVPRVGNPEYLSDECNQTTRMYVAIFSNFCSVFNFFARRLIKVSSLNFCACI